MGGILPITVHRLRASENEQPVTLSEASAEPKDLPDYGEPIAIQRQNRMSFRAVADGVESFRLRYGHVYLQRWSKTKDYRNRQDFPIRGRCHAVCDGSE